MLSKFVFKIIAVFIIGTIGGIFADQILWPYFIERPLFYEYRLDQSPIYINETKEITIQENTALKKAVEKVEKSVIGVKTQTKTGKFLEGSGVIISSDGLMVTLAELVPYGSTFNFYIDGKQVVCKILKRDLEQNLALIKIEQENLPTVKFADLEKLKLGERVFLVGVIFRKKIPQKMVNQGIIKYFNEDLLHTSIFESKVVQGSPLFDIEGNVLGINTIDSQGKVITISISKIKTFTGF
ncbi:trypsin-like peptidase domain-containing protein [Candidatus Parcubacteria bacterium]|nr:trypsin-like peptidase domain-containing protein [Candidatus Parcubacteria bacterium]